MILICVKPHDDFIAPLSSFGYIKIYTTYLKFKAKNDLRT